MGTLTLDEIKEEIRSNLGNRTDQDSRLTRVINLSQMRIARRKRWEELKKSVSTTISDTGDIEVDRFLGMPSNTRDIYSVIVIDGTSRWRKLRRVDQRLWDRAIIDAEQYSRRMPALYTRWQNMLELYPVQDQDYTVRSRICVWPTPMSDASASAVSDFEEKDDMIIALSTSYIFNSLKKSDEASKYWGIYRDMLEDAISEDNEQPDLDMLPRPGALEQGPVTEWWKDPFIRGL